VHDLLGGADASISLVTEEGGECEDDMHVNVARAGEEDDYWQEPDDS
jgi:hypothetical protein